MTHPLCHLRQFPIRAARVGALQQIGNRAVKVKLFRGNRA